MSPSDRRRARAKRRVTRLRAMIRYDYAVCLLDAYYFGARCQERRYFSALLCHASYGCLD